jgi:hypothetical protein
LGGYLKEQTILNWSGKRLRRGRCRARYGDENY